MKTNFTYNIKVSIAEIIISFEFDYKPFEEKLIKILEKFIVKSEKSDVNIYLNKIDTYELIDGERQFFVTDIIEDKIATIFQWNIKGELNLDTNNGIFNLYKKNPDFYSIIKFILLSISPKFNTLLLHSSSMVNNEFGIIGSGVSGSGKSTFAKKLELEGFTILHDEITLIRKINSRFYIYPTPFNYNPKHIVNFSPAKELKYLFFLKQEQNYYTKDINLKDFNKKILKVIFSNTKLRIKYFDIILDLINAIYFSKIIKKEISFNLSESLINHIL